MSIMDNQYSNLLSTLYPVGSIYIGTQDTCPLTSLIAGSQWQKVATQVVTNVNATVAVYGTGKALGLYTNQGIGYGLINGDYGGVGILRASANAYNQNVGQTNPSSGFPTSNQNFSIGVTNDGSKSGLTGTLTRTNLALNIWKRTA